MRIQKNKEITCILGRLKGCPVGFDGWDVGCLVGCSDGLEDVVYLADQMAEMALKLAVLRAAWKAVK
jgi:hypothetical protein